MMCDKIILQLFLEDLHQAMSPLKIIYHYISLGPGSLVGIVTGYGLHGLGIESWWGARFLIHVQTGPGAHPASFTMCTGFI
jgi:hypothetical protein